MCGSMILAKKTLGRIYGIRLDDPCRGRDRVYYKPKFSQIDVMFFMLMGTFVAIGHNRTSIVIGLVWIAVARTVNGKKSVGKKSQ